MSILTIVIVLAAAFIGGWLAERIALPRVVGQIMAGVILGPAILHLLVPGHDLNLWAEIGVLLLMFLAGIESDLTLLKRHARQSVAVALAGVVTPFVVFWLFGLVLGISDEKALFWAVLFSATSVSITAQILSEAGQIQSDAGATILGAAVLDDLLAILMWTIYQTVFGIGGQSNQPLWLTLVWMLAFLFVALLVMVKVVPLLLRLVSRLSLPGASLAVTLILILLVADLAELVKISGAIVAFLFGVTLSRQPNAKGLERGIQLLGQSLFIPIFFVNIGLKVTFAGQLANLWLIALLTGLAILTKWSGAFLGAKVAGLKTADAQIVGIGMVSRGEMAIVIADLALTAKALSEQDYALLTFVILLTTVFTPIALKPHLRQMKP